MLRRLFSLGIAAVLTVGGCSSNDDAAIEETTTTATAQTTATVDPVETMATMSTGAVELSLTIPDGWRVVDRSEDSFVIALPDTWIETTPSGYLASGWHGMTEYVLGGLQRELEEERYLYAEDPALLVNVAVDVDWRQSGDSIEVREEQYPVILSDHFDFDVESIRMIVDGHDALLFTFDAGGFGDLMTYQYFVFTTNDLYIVTFNTPDSERDGETIEEIISTYRIIE